MSESGDDDGNNREEKWNDNLGLREKEKRNCRMRHGDNLDFSSKGDNNDRNEAGDTTSDEGTDRTDWGMNMTLGDSGRERGTTIPTDVSKGETRTDMEQKIQVPQTVKKK